MDFDKPPRDEAWWTTQLLRNEKRTESYMGLLGEPGPLEEIQPATHKDDLELIQTHLDVEDETEMWLDTQLESDPDSDPESDLEAEPEHPDLQSTNNLADEMDSAEEESAGSDGYNEIARLARDFAIDVYELQDKLGDPSGIRDITLLAAGNIGANLAGGHGLGYEEETICGNIVKCRWALRDCEFCREMLEHFISRHSCPELASLHAQCRELEAALRDRISRLRARVWW